MSPVPRRRFDREWQAHIKKLSTTIGEVILAMNLLQATLFGVFWKLLDPYPELDAEAMVEGGRYLPVDQALAVWNVLSSDATQRDMMLAAAEGLWLATPKNRTLATIRWIKLKADSLGRIRNDAAHLVVILDRTANNPKGELVPSMFGMPPSRLKRLQEVKRIEDRFRHVVGDINQLRGYALGMVFQLMGSLEPLPKRPKLRAVPDQK